MIAQFVPGGVGADFDSFDLGGPVLGEEDVVDVVGPVFVVPEIVRRLSLLALRLGKEMMVGAGKVMLFEQADHGGVVACLAVGIRAVVVPKRIAVEIATDDGGFAGEPTGVVDDSLIQLADIAADVTASNGHGPNGNQQKITPSA
jgi:hypothetical protein